MGRKGIGKFAGFGIATVLEVETTSKKTGERTKFRLDLEALRGDSYIATGPRVIPALTHDGPDEA